MIEEFQSLGNIAYLIPFIIIGLRYTIFAGLFYLLFYVWKRKDWFYLKIQQKFPSNQDILREISYSMISLCIFSLVIIGVFTLRAHGYTKMYMDITDRSWGYFIFSVVTIILFHDTYFYWTHKLMHHPKIFEYVHRVHHLSTNPSPWAAFAFHPVEALVEIGFIPIIIMIMPVNRLAIAIAMLFMIFMNTMGHSGYEIFGKKFKKLGIIKWYNSSTHHNMHHKYFKGNYGLYFNVWDRILGTNFPNYEEKYEEAISRPEEINPSELSSASVQEA